MPMPHKGHRLRAYTRVTPDVLADAQRHADARKIPLSDYIAEALTEKAQRDSRRKVRAA